MLMMLYRLWRSGWRLEFDIYLYGIMIGFMGISCIRGFIEGFYSLVFSFWGFSLLLPYTRPISYGFCRVPEG